MVYTSEEITDDSPCLPMTQKKSKKTNSWEITMFTRQHI